MKKRNTNHDQKKMSAEAARLLRAERGAMARIARLLGVHRSMVSKVANGEKTSKRVRAAVTKYLVSRARQLDTAAFLIEHRTR